MVAAAEEPEVEEQAEEEQVVKRPRVAPRQVKPEDLEEGTPVLYFGGSKGLVKDAYQPIDEFWVGDAETGDLVKDHLGEIVTFKSADLSLVPAPPAPLGTCEVSAVVVIAKEQAAVQILEHFGQPNSEMRCNPQQLIAIPCSYCADPSKLSTLANEGVAQEVLELGKTLRPDIHVGVRALHLRQVLERMGPANLQALQGFYVIAAAQLPEPLESIDEGGHNMWEKHRRKEVFSQVDLCPTVTIVHPETEEPEDATRLALGQTCGVEISDKLWSETTQQVLRQRMGSDLPVRLRDASGMQVNVAILPEEARGFNVHGVLCFKEPPGANYDPPREASPEPAAKAPDADDTKMGGKTIAEWEKTQAEFAGEPKLAPGWLRIKSRSSGDVYFFNKKTKETTFEMPEELPEGWTKQVSKSTGKTYFFNAKLKKSSFDKPTA